jgi:hypothetical protein
VGTRGPRGTRFSGPCQGWFSSNQPISNSARRPRLLVDVDDEPALVLAVAADDCAVLPAYGVLKSHGVAVAFAACADPPNLKAVSSIWLRKNSGFRGSSRGSLPGFRVDPAPAAHRFAGIKGLEASNEPVPFFFGQGRSISSMKLDSCPTIRGGADFPW